MSGETAIPDRLPIKNHQLNKLQIFMRFLADRKDTFQGATLDVDDHGFIFRPTLSAGSFFVFHILLRSGI